MQTSNTLGGAITDFGFLFEKLITIPSVKEVISQTENQIAKEDKASFERFEKAVNWIQNKIKSLLPFFAWEKDSWQLRHILSLPEFQMLSLGSRGYLSDLLYELRRVTSEALKNQNSHSLFEEWAQIGRLGSGKFCILKFHFPSFLDQEINKPRLQDQINQWKEQSDTSLFCFI